MRGGRIGAGSGAAAKGEAARVKRGGGRGGGAEIQEEGAKRGAKVEGAPLSRFASRPGAMLRILREAVQHGASKAG